MENAVITTMNIIFLPKYVKRKRQYDNKYIIKKAQKIKIENRVKDNTFSLVSVHKLWFIRNECCKTFEINNKKMSLN